MCSLFPSNSPFNGYISRLPRVCIFCSFQNSHCGVILLAKELLEIEPRTHIKSLFAQAHIRDYPKGQILLYQGEKTEQVFLINSGHVKVYDVTSAGSEKLIMILGPGDIFPLIWSFGAIDDLHYFYETFDDAQVAVIERQKLLKAIDEKHELTKELLQYFVDRSQELMTRIDCIDGTSARNKVLQVLLYLATAHGVETLKHDYRLDLQVTHQSIADMAGLTRATASIQLKEIEEDGAFEHVKDAMLISVDRIKELLEP